MIQTNWPEGPFWSISLWTCSRLREALLKAWGTQFWSSRGLTSGRDAEREASLRQVGGTDKSPTLTTSPHLVSHSVLQGSLEFCSPIKMTMVKISKVELLWNLLNTLEEDWFGEVLYSW